MHKFPITEYKRFEELPFDKFDRQNFSIYILDFEWNYLFVNAFVGRNLGTRGQELIGKNIWLQFPALKRDPFFSNFKVKMETVGSFNGVTVSPLTGQKINVVGYALEDCYYCTSSAAPVKDELISELRKEIAKTR